MKMPLSRLLALFVALLSLMLPSRLLAYSRPDAISLASDTAWVVMPCKPIVELVKDRSAKPDFPRLFPSLEAVIPREVQEGSPLPSGEWQSVVVPAAWESALGIEFNGAAWYGRDLQVPRAWLTGNSRVWLEFDSVATVAGVWVNGRWCGGNVGDWVRWRVDITDALAQESAMPAVQPTGGWGLHGGRGLGADEIAARLLIYVDELPGHMTQGFPSMIGPHHGGIWQDCRIYRTGQASVPPGGIKIITDPASGAVTMIAQVEGASPQLGSGIAVQWRKPDGTWQDVYSSQGDNSFLTEFDSSSGQLRASFVLPKEVVTLWQPTRPNIYQLTLVLGEVAGPSDRVQERFAFRTITTDGYRFRLNGLQLYLRSALNWGWYPGKIAPLPDPETVRDEFRQIKSLGFNAETVCLLVMPDYFYDIADEEGILLWQEYPAWHNEVTVETQAEYLRLYEQFYRRDMNRPSIILRSLTCENGEMDSAVVAELLALGRRLTDEPLQDNTSWLWMSKPELTDWYDEHNYYNCHQWVKYTLETLPAQLNELPDKPFLIGESILFNTWPDTRALLRQWEEMTSDAHSPDTASPATAKALAQRRSGEKWPYWFPSCFQSVLDTEAALRSDYAGLLKDGPQGRPADIVLDYLLPQSYDYAMQSRRFQIELMHASPRYSGYTINVVRDMPLIRAGLLDDLGRLRWDAKQWSWHGDHTKSKVAIDSTGQPAGGSREALLSWETGWDAEIDRSVPVLVYDIDSQQPGQRGAVQAAAYRDAARWLDGWDAARLIVPGTLADTNPAIGHSPLVVTPVLTTELAEFAQRGGVVVICASKWPGALGSHPHFFWRDSIFVPPVGPWAEGSSTAVPAGQRVTDRVVRLQSYDLTQSFGEVIPVSALGIKDNVDPLLRLFDTHDLSTVETYDQLFAAKAGKGLVIATSLDHGSAGGQWVLSKLLTWGLVWKLREMQGRGSDFPRRSLSDVQLADLAVARANGILDLNAAWRFRLDPLQSGESDAWMNPAYDDSDWQEIPSGRSWEALGINVNGMGWYRQRIAIPADWANGRVKLVCEGVDDAYVVWVNGQRVAQHGSFTVHEETVWLQQTVTDITAALKPGEENLIVLQVVDITGQGGAYKPVYLAVE